MAKIEATLKGKELISLLLDGGSIILCRYDVEEKAHLLVKLGKELINKNDLGRDAKVTYASFSQIDGSDVLLWMTTYFCNGNAAKGMFNKDVNDTRRHQTLAKHLNKKEGHNKYK